MKDEEKFDIGDYVFENKVLMHEHKGTYYASAFLFTNSEDRKLIIRVLKAHPFVSNYFDCKTVEEYCKALKKKKDAALAEIQLEKQKKSPSKGKLVGLQKSLDFYESKIAELEIPDAPDSIDSYVITCSASSGRNRSMVTARGQAEKLEKLFAGSKVLDGEQFKRCLLWETVLRKTLKDVDRRKTLLGRLRMLFRKLVNFRKF